MDLTRAAAVLFDFDRTLFELYVDRRELLVIRDQMIGILRGLGVSTDVLTDVKHEDDGYRLWYKLIDFHGKGAVVEGALPLFEDLFESRELANAMLGNFLPGVSEALKLLFGGGAAIAIVTSNLEQTVRTALKRVDSRIAEDIVVVGRPRPIDPQRMKPAAWPLLKALDLLDVQPGSNVFFLGDSLDDIRSGLSARCTPIGVATGEFSRDELSAAGAYHTVASLKNLFH